MKEEQKQGLIRKLSRTFTEKGVMDLRGCGIDITSENKDIADAIATGLCGYDTVMQNAELPKGTLPMSIAKPTVDDILKKYGHPKSTPVKPVEELIVEEIEPTYVKEEMLIVEDAVPTYEPSESLVVEDVVPALTGEYPDEVWVAEQMEMPAEEPTQEPMQKVVEEPTQEPIQKVVEEPVQEMMEMPAQEKAEEPAQETTVFAPVVIPESLE